MNSRLHISIAFGDIILPITVGKNGHKLIPLKPICDSIGLNWNAQKRKFENNSYIKQRLGAEISRHMAAETLQKQGNPNRICIRIDRVSSFLLTINPEKVRGMGNDEAADWLEAKHKEWDDALHAYETSIDGIFGKQKNAGVKQLSELYKLRNLASSLQEKATIQRMINAQFSEMGHDLAAIKNPQDELPLQSA